MSLLLIIIHVIVCLALIMIVLLQTGKGADMGAAFGGGSSQTLFGSTGASTFLTKATTAAAIIFMITSLGLAYMSGNKTGDSIMNDTKTPIEQHAEPEKNLPAQEPVRKEEATKAATASEPDVSQSDVPAQAEKNSQN
ncbi:MAG: preprotein translocase subunit SecG [Desulfobacteraceae bacterium]|nr:preprotein translocase subunit SecG [Desulfobacteraceae bacterium]MBC2720027.1 preprotein translocase subunit SecG [Desulfobacteraceae bacterium]